MTDLDEAVKRLRERVNIMRGGLAPDIRIVLDALAVVDRARQDDWEYGIEYEIDSERSEFTLAHSERQARKWVAESPTDTGLRRRHPATEWEPVPDTEGSDQ